MYEFDKTDFLTTCNYHSLVMLYGKTDKDRSQSRDKLLALVKDLADSYSKALESLNAIELTKSGGSESEFAAYEKDSPKSNSVCQFTWNTMSDKCRIWLEKGKYYIFVKPEIERLKENCERKRKEAVERCFG